MAANLRRLRVNQLLGYAFGGVFILVGLLGFTVSTGFLSTNSGALLGLEVNGLHNVVHILLGALLVAGALSGARTARSTNLLVGAGYLAVTILGFFIVDTSLNFLALNSADNIFHLFVALILIGAAGAHRSLDTWYAGLLNKGEKKA